jgi:cell wall-associated NlpC family hydrolase
VAAGVGTGVVSALAAGAVVSAPSASADDRGPATRQDRIEQGLDVVRDQKGDSYGYGGDGPDRFDCSGLVSYAFSKAGFDHVPRTASAQARHMNRIDRSNMRPGDFVFFYDGAATAESVYHVGVFTGWDHGRRMVIHSPSSGRRVGTDPIWDGDWFAGTLRGLG